MDYLEQHVDDMRIIAEYIHDTECHSNHTDGCGWYYDKMHAKDNIEYLWSLGDHEDYYDIASKRTKNMSQEDIYALVRYIHNYETDKKNLQTSKNNIARLLPNDYYGKISK